MTSSTPANKKAYYSISNNSARFNTTYTHVRFRTT